MSVAQGNDLFRVQGAILVAERETWDPIAGTRYVQEWEGVTTGIVTAANQFSAAGAQVQFDIRCPGKKKLLATWGRDPTQPASIEPPYDRWELEMEFTQADIFNHPAVMREANAGYAPGNPANPAAGYRRAILDAVNQGLAYPFVAATLPVGAWVYGLLTTNTQHWTAQLPVLRRVRTFSTSYVNRWVSSAVPTVYPRSVLVSSPVFAVPADIQAQLPTDPPEPAPPNATYGWMLSQQFSAYMVSTKKWEERLQWNFGAWITGLYQIAS